MTDKQTGGPAFPHTVEYKGADCGGVVPHGGMSLRDYFAAKAMQATVQAWISTSQYPSTDLDVAENAYAVADAMLKARDEIAVGRKIEELGLLVKTKNLLKADDICTVEQLTQLTSNHLLKIPNMGRKSVREIEQALFMQGLSLRDGNP